MYRVKKKKERKKKIEKRKCQYDLQCRNHNDGTAMGILCEPLCTEKGIHSLACETLHTGKEAVFSAHWEATRLVFKAYRLIVTLDM